jgi:hypothetical protein
MNYNTISSDQSVDTAIAALKERRVEAVVVGTKEEALSAVKANIPPGSSIMNGASKTLEQIGFIEYLKSGSHGWNNLHEGVLLEKDPAKQAQLRRQSALSDYYVGSVHALAETGELVIASNSGSQLPHIAFTSPNVIFVVGAQKIVPSLAAALDRLEKYVVPLEDERMKSAYGYGTMLCKILILNRENPAMKRKVRLILVKESLGF